MNFNISKNDLLTYVFKQITLLFSSRNRWPSLSVLPMHMFYGAPLGLVGYICCGSILSSV